MNTNLEKLNLNNSDISANTSIHILQEPVLNIKKLDLKSQYFNLDKALIVIDRLTKYLPKSTTSNNTQKSAQIDIPVRLQNGNIDFRRILTGNIELNNTRSDISLHNNILYLNRLRTNIFKGYVDGNITVDLIKMIIYTDLKGNNINVAKALLDAANMKDMLSGTASFAAKLSINGAAATQTEQLKGIAGNIDFVITKGQFGPFGKIENLIIAENIRESQFFQTALGGIINSLTSIDTTHFSELIGHLTLDNGVCTIDPITSLGSTLSLHIFGDFDLIQNYADMKVRARMSSIISKLLGPINAINPVNIMNSAASLNVVTAKAFSLFCEVVPSEELDTLPNFSNKYIDSGAAKFQLKVQGDAAKPLKLVKSFKWLTSQAQFNQASDYVNSLPDQIEGSTATNIEEAIAEYQALEAEKKTLKYKVRHIFDNEKDKD